MLGAMIKIRDICSAQAKEIRGLIGGHLFFVALQVFGVKRTERSQNL